MKDGDIMFEKIMQCLITRNNSGSLGNDNFTIETEEITDLCKKHGKLLVLFDGAFSAFYTKRGKFTDAMCHELVSDLEHIRQCWTQLNMSITPKLHIIFSHMPYLLKLFNGGFDKLEESRIESSHQSRARDHHRLCRMGDKVKADVFELKLQHMHVNKDIGHAQNQVHKFTKRNIVVRSMSLKKKR